MKPDEPEQPTPTPKRASKVWGIFRSVTGTILGLTILGVVVGGLVAVFHPDTPLPREWNPTAPLSVADPVTPVTMWKLRAAMRNPARCVAALQTGAAATLRPPREDTVNCHIQTRVGISQVGGMTALSPPLSETSCAAALRLAMWERHGVQPAARAILGAEVSTVHQVGSYNCRPIRTTGGTTNRWSTHATADAIDITGFDLSNGQSIRLISDWDGTATEARFLRAVHDSACTWFATTLGPDYNSLHADHFHLQSRGWGTCR